MVLERNNHNQTNIRSQFILKIIHTHIYIHIYIFLHDILTNIYR